MKTQKNCLAEYVGTELSLKRGKIRLRADVLDVRIDRDKELYERQIRIDAQIDKLVYDLYGLTEEEIEIVEKSP